VENLGRIIAEHPFCNGLNPHYVDLLIRCASNVRFDDDQHLFRERGEANEFYLIREGKVALEVVAPQRPPLIMETVAEGEVLGWSWLVPPHRWDFDARAVGPVRAIAVDGKCLRAKCEKNHDLGYELFKRIVDIVCQRSGCDRVGAQGRPMKNRSGTKNSSPAALCRCGPIFLPYLFRAAHDITLESLSEFPEASGFLTCIQCGTWCRLPVRRSDAKGQEESPALRRAFAGRVEHRRTVPRRAVQVGSARHRTDYGNQANGGRAGGAQEQRKRGKGVGNVDRGIACAWSWPERIF
jgi:CRP/FNR family transcriptional regulator, cyclic AMP receptor protein